jgi:type IV pilus assembly protein PilC
VVLPAFSGLYSSLGAELPWTTQILLVVSDKLQAYGLYLIVSLLVAGGLIFAYIRTSAGRYKWDRLMLRQPLLGRINHLNELARCCRSISLLFRAGLSLTEIIPLIIHGTRNKVVISALTDVNREMLKGEGLSKPMSRNALFLPMMVQMVKVGEETGNLDVTLVSVAQNYETEAEDRTRSLISLIQPAMTLIIGLVVGFVTMSLISAMYSMYGQGI